MNNSNVTYHLIFLLFLLTTILSAQEATLDTVKVTAHKYTIENMHRESARQDIAKGIILIQAPGWPIFGPTKKDSLANIYGFQFTSRGCTATGDEKYYNDEVIKYLSKRNGEGWWDKFQKEAAKLKEEEIPTLPKND